MRQVAEIKYHDGAVHRFTVEESERLAAIEADGKKSALLPDGSSLRFSSIASWDIVNVADYVAVMDTPLPARVDLDAIKPQNEYQERWHKLSRLNGARLKAKSNPYEKVALLKDLNDLDQYEATGQWPEYVHPSQWPSRVAKKPGGSFIFIKRRMSRPEYDRGKYADQPQCYFLAEEEGDIWVARIHVRVQGKRIPDGWMECEEAESTRLDYVRAAR